MEAIYLNDWAKTNWGLALLKDDFQIRGDELKDVEILLASYTCAKWEGDAFVLFRKDGIGGWHDEIDVFRSELIKVLNGIKEGK